MPPKPKFTRNELIEAALGIVSEGGLEALTARELGERLGSSARPIFTVFKNMDELVGEVKKAALEKYFSFVDKALHYTPLYKRYGMQMILFAKEEPNLFRILFMKENSGVSSFGVIFEELSHTAENSIGIIIRDYSLDERSARIVFENTWIYTYGISVLCATGMCDFSEEQIVQMLGLDFLAILKRAKEGKLDVVTPNPMPKENAGDFNVKDYEKIL